MDPSAPSASSIMATAAYQELLRRRRALVLGTATPPFVLLMALTALVVFTPWLDGELVPGLNPAIVLAYVVFFLPVVCAHVYVARVRRLDVLADEALAQAAAAEGGRA